MIFITKTADGKLVWLETGSSSAGSNHIIFEHTDDFMRKGISFSEIPDFIYRAVTYGKIIGHQGSKNTRTIFEIMYNGQLQRVAITISDNGFIIGVNPKTIP